MKNLLFLFVSLFLFFSCNSAENPTAKIEKQNFGQLKDGSLVERYILTNVQGMQVSIITYGGIITSILMPDKKGKMEDIVLGYDNLADYEKNNPYFGAIIGRYGNRIANGRFNLDGKQYDLAKNNGKNHLHGGLKGFDKVIWKAESSTSKGEAILTLRYSSKDGEEGYPGNLNSKVIYRLTDDNELKIQYEAETDKKTIVNLTQHSYFNLSGDPKTTILDHELKLNADGYLPVDETFIPLGNIAPVKNTPFDFTQAKLIGKDIQAEDEQIKRGLGYDHCWVLNSREKGRKLAAVVEHKKSGRLMEVYTDQPGIQFYTGNFLDGTNPIKNQNGTYGHRSGLCLETQHFPDSPNQPNFPTVILNPGEKYQTETIFKFKTH